MAPDTGSLLIGGGALAHLLPITGRVGGKALQRRCPRRSRRGDRRGRQHSGGARHRGGRPRWTTPPPRGRATRRARPASKATASPHHGLTATVPDAPPTARRAITVVVIVQAHHAPRMADLPRSPCGDAATPAARAVTWRARQRHTPNDARVAAARGPRPRRRRPRHHPTWRGNAAAAAVAGHRCRWSRHRRRRRRRRGSCAATGATGGCGGRGGGGGRVCVTVATTVTAAAVVAAVAAVHNHYDHVAAGQPPGVVARQPQRKRRRGPRRAPRGKARAKGPRGARWAPQGRHQPETGDRPPGRRAGEVSGDAGHLATSTCRRRARGSRRQEKGGHLKHNRERWATSTEESTPWTRDRGVSTGRWPGGQDEIRWHELIFIKCCFPASSL